MSNTSPLRAGAFAAPRSELNLLVRTPQGEQPISDAKGWDVELHETGWDGPGAQVTVKATWRGDQPVDAGLVFRVPVLDGPVFIPSVWAHDNGTGNAHTRYPRLGPLSHEDFTALGWTFKSERTSTPAAFGSGAWIAIEPNGTGVGFSLAGHPELSVYTPGIETPFTHDRLDDSPTYAYHHVRPNESIACTIWYGDEDKATSDSVAAVNRSLQILWGGADARLPLEKSTDPVNDPALRKVRAAADAAVFGLLQWHHRPELAPGVLVETVAFDLSDIRPAMHVGWVSGSLTAYALLRRGLRDGDASTVETAKAVLDKISTGLSPGGAFWGIWTPEGWKAGWNGDSKKVHARTIAEATLFLVRSMDLLRAKGADVSAEWEKAIRSNLDLVLRSIDASGNPGSFYHVDSGEVVGREGTNGLLWASALVEAAQALGEQKYFDAAIRVGEHYADAIRENTLRGAPEDIGQCPSSEDGYNAVISSMSLYEATGDGRWLELARVAADWMLAMNRWSYDVRFPEGTPLDRMGYQTRGADVASPSNHHLHDYGLICQRELLRLSELTGDDWYAKRAADHLASFVGMVATKDGAFGGAEKRGMKVEQLYPENWSTEGRAGEFANTGSGKNKDVGASHAWCLGMIVLAGDEWTARQSGE